MKDKKPKITLSPYAERLSGGEVTRETLLNEREVILDLYKHHLKLLLEANVFVYAVTGALMSFVITHLTAPHVRWVFLFVAIFASAFAVFFWKAGDGIDINEQELDVIAGALRTNTVPKLIALKLGLGVSSVALWIVVALTIAAAIWLR
jgi:hypothetical protein